MSKHTPGPWQVVTEEHPHYLGGAHVERRIFTVWEHPQLKDAVGVVNCSIGIPAIKGEPAVRFVSIEEADACLISQVPAMLEALEAVEVYSVYMSEQLQAQIRAVIRAAKGEA